MVKVSAPAGRSARHDRRGTRNLLDGLGIPFLLLALGLTRAGRVAGWLRRHGRAIERLGGALLITMGVLMITGAWLRLFTPVLRVFSRSGWPPI